MTNQIIVAPSENMIGHVTPIYDLLDLTFTCDTSIFANGDVINTATHQAAGCYRLPGGRMMLRSLVLLDEDDQGTAVDLVFFSSNVVLGVMNAAPSITDADHRSLLGVVSVVAGDFIDFGGARAATKTGLNLLLEDTGADQALYLVAVVRSGTPTYTVNGLRVRLGLEKY